MTEQSQFLDALGVTVNGVSLDNAISPPPERAPNPPGTNNYLHAHEDYVFPLEGTSASVIAENQATYNGQAVHDGAAARYAAFREAESWGRRSEGEEEDDNDDGESTDLDALSEASWHRRQGPQRILMGIGDEDGLDDGDWESESEWSLADSMHDYDNPERILCQSDQEFPIKGHLFLVKWKDCSILSSSWEWENVEYALGDGPLGFFLKIGSPIRDAWEERKRRQARGEEDRFDVAKWKANVEEVDSLRARRRVLRRWRRKLVAIRQVMEAEKEDEEADFPLDMMRRIEKEDREDAERREREKATEERGEEDEE